MIYCMSDVHGDYEKYRRMLEKIRLSDGDLLYLLGDVVDRGPHPVRTLLDMMQRPNVKPLLGNHEYMAVLCLRFLTKQVTEESVSALCAENFQDLINWQREGGSSTLREFGQLSSEQRSAVLEYLMDFELYEEIQVNGQDYLLVHAGPANFSPDRPLDSYGLHELIWTRLDYGKVYYADRFLVTGHTPVAMIPAIQNGTPSIARTGILPSTAAASQEDGSVQSVWIPARSFMWDKSSLLSLFRFKKFV